MKHSCDRNKVVVPVIIFGVLRTIADIIIAKKLYGKGADDEWKETVDFANNHKGVHPIWESDNTKGNPVLGLVSSDYMVEIMNAVKKEENE